VASFKDNAGREWIVEFNVTTLKRVRTRLGVNLANLIGDNFAEFVRVVGDPMLLCDVLFVLCEGQHAGVTDIDFGRAMAGDVISESATAMYGAMVDFSPSQLRETLTQLAKKGTAVQTLAQEQARVGLTKFMAIDDRDLLSEILSQSVGSSPVSSESLPTG
jgi:hypothetical protein